MIRLRFVTSSDPVSAGIRAAEYGFWASHVEAVMPDGALLGAHYDGGVQARSADYDAINFPKRIVSIPAAPEMSDAFHSFLRLQLGKPTTSRRSSPSLRGATGSKPIPGSAANCRRLHW
jgi:hypothetical protein